MLVGGYALLVAIGRSSKYAPPAPAEERAFSSSCMHALGGGVVGPRGSLLHYDPRCTSELKDYFSGAYFAEVRRVADQAVSYFTQQAAAQDAARRQQQQQGGQQSRGTVIFDIDETALSNLDGFFTYSNWTSGLRSVPCNHPHLEFLELPALQEGALSWLRKVMPGQEAEVSRPLLCSAPPLRAVRDLYHVLLDHDYTVVFLTGRSEADRDATAANLLAAGYGTQCDTLSAATTTTTITTTTITTTTTSSVSAGAAGTTGAAAAGAGGRGHRMLQWALPFSKAGGATEAGAEAGGGGRRPACYAALLMREDGDERLASVFKAEARGRLAAEGHVLVGNIGDQFSDLVGTDSAVASFKLPNPVYTLL